MTDFYDILDAVIRFYLTVFLCGFHGRNIEYSVKLIFKKNKKNAGYTEIMSIGKKLKHLRISRGWQQKFVAQRIGVRQATVSEWESDKKDSAEPGPKNRKKIAALFGVSESELFLENPQNISLDSLPPKKVPVISYVQASTWIEAVDAYEPGDAQEYIFVNHKGGDMTYSVIVNGKCMESDFKEGDKILVDPDQEVLNGDLGLIKDIENNSVTFKKVTYTDKGGVILQPLNQNFQPIVLNSKKKYRILGKVIGVYRDL